MAGENGGSAEARYQNGRFTADGPAISADDFEYEPAALKKNLKDEKLKDLLPGLADSLSAVEPFTHDNAEAALRAYSEAQGVKAGLLINGARDGADGQTITGVCSESSRDAWSRTNCREVAEARSGPGGAREGR